MLQCNARSPYTDKPCGNDANRIVDLESAQGCKDYVTARLCTSHANALDRNRAVMLNEQGYGKWFGRWYERRKS